MNPELFIAKNILFKNKDKGRISQPIVKIATVGIALGIAVMILTLAIVTGFQEEIRGKIIGFSANIQVTAFDSNTSYEPRPIDKNQDFYPNITKVEGIQHIQVFAVKNGIIKTKTENQGVLLKGVGSDFDWQFIKNNLKEGEIFLVQDDSVSKDIVISKYIASKLELKIGDPLFIYFFTKSKSGDDSQISSYERRIKKLNISGIYETGFEELDKKTVYVDIAQIQKLNYWDENQVGGFEIKIDDFHDLDKLGDYVYKSIGTELSSQTVKEANYTIFSWLELQDINALIVIILMLLVAGINMISALLILILERTNMIGILKALGAGNSSIQKIFLYNAAYLIIRGLAFGNIIGLSLCLLQQSFGIITLPQETYYVSVVPIHLNMLHILLLNVGTLLICLLMLTIPSFIISKITPIKAIRFS